MHHDSLVLLPRENWIKLQNKFKNGWPRGISGYTILETQRQWCINGFDYGFKVYCPFGVVDNGMVAVNEKGVFYEIVIQCPTNDTRKLEEALKSTKKIDWNRKVIIPFAPNHIIECIKKIVHEVNVEIELILPSNSFILHRDTSLFDNLSSSPEISFGQLSPEHTDLVNSKWPHRYPGSTWYFEQLIRTKSGFGLFKDNELISWVFINEAGTLGHMFTLEEYRRQSYAELLLKSVCNQLLREGRDVFAFSVKNNPVAYDLYKKVGFQNFDGVGWCYLKPINRYLNYKQM